MMTLISRSFTSGESKKSRRYQQLGSLLTAVREKLLPDDTMQLVDQEIAHLNSIDDDQPHFIRDLNFVQQRILRLVGDRHKIFPKHHFRNQWMILGMTSFGIPVGIMIGLVMKNMAQIGAGIPIGMVVGMSIGMKMDDKVLTEGRQLDFVVKH